MGGVGRDIILDLVLTSTQVVVSGTFDEEVDFGERVLTSVGGGDAFVATFDHSGGNGWVWQLGVGDDGHESSSDIALGIDVDDEGGLYATGLFAGAADFGGGLVEASAASPRCFAVSLTASGAFRWAEVFGEGPACMGTKIAVTGTDVVSTGLFAARMSFGEDEVTMAGGQGGFLASSATADGAPQWLATFGGAPLAWGLGLAASPGGGSCVVGFFRGTLEGVDGRHESVGDDDVLVACYDRSGRQRWLRTFGGPAIDSAWGVAVSQTGDVIVTGFFTDRLEVGEETFESEGEEDAFVVGFDSDGGLLWARQLGRSQADSGLDVVVSGSGDVYVSGVLDGRTDESVPPIALTDSSLFIARLRR